MTTAATTTTTVILFLLLALTTPNSHSISPESLKFPPNPHSISPESLKSSPNPHSISPESPKFPCQPPHHSHYPFCNTTLTLKLRAQSLLSLLTLSEKIHRLCNNDTGIHRLGIPPYEWWSESLHGIAVNGPGVSFNGGIITAATGFPQVIVTAASFSRALWRSIAEAIAVEARAMYNGGQAGLTFWAPTINVFRDPRWGRGQETAGEDPAVAAAYAVEYVRGFQGEESGGEKRRVLTAGGGGGELMVSACCKHFSAYDLENWGVYTRYNFNAIVRNSYRISKLIFCCERVDS